MMTITRAMGRRTALWGAAALLLLCSVAARADSIDTLRSFVRDVQSGRANFTQTVISKAEGAPKRMASSGTFEFARPDRFRFDYLKPYEQAIVADGEKVWLYDADLNQVTVRAMNQVLGATPAAILAGGSLERDFLLRAQPNEGNVEWVLAAPKARESAFQWLRVGFRAGKLVALEIVDAFGQQSRIEFTRVESNVPIDPARFTFIPPRGADVLQ